MSYKPAQRCYYNRDWVQKAAIPTTNLFSSGEPGLGKAFNVRIPFTMTSRKAHPATSSRHPAQHLWAVDEQFESLFQEHWPRVYRMLFGLVGDHADAEDLALETFVRLYRTPPKDNQETNIGGWLHRVATNLGLNALRSTQRRKHYEQDAGRVEILENASPNPSELFAVEEEQRRVRQVLGEMKPRLAQLLVLRHSGLAYRELAEVFSVAETSIGPMLARAESEFERRFHRLETEE